MEKISHRPNTILSPEMEKVRERLKLAWEQFQKNPHIWVGDNRAQAISEWNQQW